MLQCIVLYSCTVYVVFGWSVSNLWRNTLSYLLTPWYRVLLEQLTGLQLVKKFPAFHGTRRFITALTSVRHLSILSQTNTVHIPTSHLLEIHPNIIHPSTPRSPQWSPSLRFPHQDPIHSPLLTHTRHMPSPSHSSLWRNTHRHKVTHDWPVFFFLDRSYLMCLAVQFTLVVHPPPLLLHAVSQRC